MEIFEYDNKLKLVMSPLDYKYNKSRFINKVTLDYRRLSIELIACGRRPENVFKIITTLQNLNISAELSQKIYQLFLL